MPRLPRIDETRWAVEFTDRLVNFVRRYFDSHTQVKKWLRCHPVFRLAMVRPPAGYAKPV
jgi:hypothetical protein